MVLKVKTCYINVLAVGQSTTFQTMQLLERQAVYVSAARAHGS